MVFIFLLLSFFYHGSPDKEITVDRIVYEHFYNETGEHAYDELVLFNRIVLAGGKEGYIVTDWLLVNEPQGQAFHEMYMGQTNKYYKFVINRNNKMFRVRSIIYQETYGYMRDIERSNQDIFHPKLRISVLK